MGKMCVGVVVMIESGGGPRAQLRPVHVATALRCEERGAVHRAAPKKEEKGEFRAWLINFQTLGQRQAHLVLGDGRAHRYFKRERPDTLANRVADPALSSNWAVLFSAIVARGP